MSEPLNRAQFKAYIFRRLGYPVIQVNVEDEQAEDRIDDALAFFSDYHPLGSEKTLYVHTLTEDDVATKSITLPENIMAVTGLVPPTAFVGNNFMSDRYQFLRQEFFNITQNVSTSLIPYYAAMTRISDIDFLFNMSPSFRFNKHKNKIEIIGGDTNRIFIVGQKIIFETQAIIDSKTYSDIWKDRWLKKYATALMKRQWAENLKLYSGVPLLGGITLDANSMYQEAIEELNILEDKLITSGSAPVLDEIG